jgi:hypothetical protein
MSTQTLSFYTTGEGFTNLLTQFFEEGQFVKVYETLHDGGLPHEMIVAFFEGRGYFEGDTRENGDLSYHTRDHAEKPQDQRWYWAMRNFITLQKDKKDHHVPAGRDQQGAYEEFEYSTYYKYESLLDALTVKAWEEDEHLQVLRKIITRESLINLIWKRVLKDEGYPVVPEPHKDMDLGAVILRSGDVVECPYMCHVSLFPKLYVLGLASSPDWTDDSYCIHVSSGQIGGSVAYALERAGITRDGNDITPEQIQTLVKFKRYFRKMYGKWETIMETIRDYTCDVEDFGGKYNNLTFLKNYYPHIKTPAFSKEPIPGKRSSIRTSPKYSLPGLLNSRFNVTNTEQAIDEMTKEFEQYKDIREDNELHLFYQEYLEGVNGVCHYSRSGFSYAIGDEQGDVVKGKKSGKRLSVANEKALQKIAKELFEDLEVTIQLEFVVSGKDVYIVQLRKLENDFERTAGIPPPNQIIVTGRTFSKGTLKGLTADDILIVDEDADSKALLGKKALIVKSNVEFSHILALSSALRIPSIYATGDFTLPAGKVNIQAYNENGYIHK